MSNERAVATRTDADIVEQVVIQGDLGKLDATGRVTYYRQVCDSLGLNPFTRPFDYITLNGKLTLYAKRDATDQLRKLHNVCVSIVGRERMEDIYVVTARATLPNGRTDESIGAVALGTLKGEALANAVMKAETKAKRRVTLSIVGLGWLDETETDSIPTAQPVNVSVVTGEIDYDGEPMGASAPVVEQHKASIAASLAASDKRAAWSPSDKNRWVAEKRSMALSDADVKRLLSLPDGAGLSSLGTIDEVLARLKAALSAETAEQPGLPEPPDANRPF